MQDAIVTFLIPVRHPSNAPSWPRVVDRLRQTAHSIAAQTDVGWRALVIANEEADIPELPAGFEIVRVGFGPNLLHDLSRQNRDEFYDSLRLDKGRRVLAGMLEAKSSAYIMIVDDDDFVCREVVAFARRNMGQPGWSVASGYVWSEGGRVVYLHPNLARICGTSHIVRADLYNIPASIENAGEDYIKDMLGSHIWIEKRLAAQGSPLVALPFAGAVYRVGHPESHSKSRGVLRKYLLDPTVLSSPVRIAKNLSRIRLVTPRLRREFGMSA